MKILEVKGLVKHYPLEQPLLSRLRGQRRVIKALNGVTLDLEQGEALGLVGESGSGKSTLARCVLCLEAPTGGRIIFKQQDLLRLGASQLRKLRRLFQPVFQDPYSSLNPTMRVGAIVAEPLAIHKIGSSSERRQRVRAILGRVGLDPEVADRYPHAFSGGQRQRIAIARALAPEPELLVADEPVSALDVSVQSQILNLFRDLKQNLGLTLLFVSHSLPVVRNLCDRVAVIFKGRLVELSPTRNLFNNPLHPYTRQLLASTPLAPEPVRLRGREDISSDGVGELVEVEPGHWVAGAS